MSDPSLVRPGLAALALALALSACATAPEPGPVARDETGVIVAARPIVVANADLVGAPIASGFSPVAPRPGTVPAATPEPRVPVRVIADTVRAGETQRGVSYTIRRDRDGTLFEVSQPENQALVQGARVNIAYGDRTRITPAV